jgi:hypothetical protein
VGGADFTEADVSGAVFRGVLGEAKGMDAGGERRQDRAVSC